jgi:predicted RNase H-like nuclease
VRVLGVDLAWAEGSVARTANETGMIAVDGSGEVLDAGWACGVDETIRWVDHWACSDVLAVIDAPLVVENPTGQRLCEKNVGQRYGRWKVSANSTNLGSARCAGVTLRCRLESAGWMYDDGRTGPPKRGRVLSEVYPYTTIVGAHELGYDAERPTYKRKPKGTTIAAFRPVRAEACDALLTAIGRLEAAIPRLDLRSHPVTAKLLNEPSPLDDREYKHREDLIDAALCAWTGLLWLTTGLDRCQVLGLTQSGVKEATIIAPSRPQQRPQDNGLLPKRSG